MASNLLIVEDGSADEWLILRALRSIAPEVTVHCVKDGDEAVAYLASTSGYEDRSNCPPPDLILLDLKLPRRSGFEVLSWLRQDPRPLRMIPVAVLTSSNLPDDVTSAYAFGANAYIVKPATFLELQNLLAATIGFWMGHNVSPAPFL